MAKNTVPVRMCSGCMARREKGTLLRVARDADSNVFVDKSGRFNGRGAYVCADVQCIKKAKKRNWFSRSLGCKVPPEIYDELMILADGE